VSSDGVLSAEFESCQSPSPQNPPHFVFSISRNMAHLTGESQQTRPSIPLHAHLPIFHAFDPGSKPSPCPLPDYRERVRDGSFERRSERGYSIWLVLANFGAVAQLGEHHVCNVGVAGSSPVGSISSASFFLQANLPMRCHR